MLTKQETLTGRGAWAESSGVKTPRRTALPPDLQPWVSWWWGLISGLSLANHSDSGCFVVACALLSQNGFQREEFWGW